MLIKFGSDFQHCKNTVKTAYIPFTTVSRSLSQFKLSSIHNCVHVNKLDCSSLCSLSSEKYFDQNILSMSILVIVYKKKKIYLSSK